MNRFAISVTRARPPCVVCRRRTLTVRFGRPPQTFWACWRPAHIALAADKQRAAHTQLLQMLVDARIRELKQELQQALDARQALRKAKLPMRAPAGKDTA